MRLCNIAARGVRRNGRDGHNRPSQIILDEALHCVGCIRRRIDRGQILIGQRQVLRSRLQFVEQLEKRVARKHLHNVLVETSFIF